MGGGCRAGAVPLGITLLPSVLQGGMLLWSFPAPGASAGVPSVPFLANACCQFIFYKPSVFNNDPLFILMGCCVLGHHPLPKER